MKLAELKLRMEGLKKWEDAINWEQFIPGIVSDSRTVREGQLYVAIAGAKVDGHNYIQEALQKGAAAVIIENDEHAVAGTPWILVQDSRRCLGLLAQAYYGDPSKKMRMIGVTGTNGKTTTTYMIAYLLEKANHKVGLAGTIHNRIGTRILPGKLTTPDALTLAHLFSEMVSEGVEYAVMEVSSHALAQERVAGVEYDVAVFTNLTQDHLDFHGDMENYLETKSKLFSELASGQQSKSGKVAILNADDKAYSYFADHCRVPVISYGFESSYHVHASKVLLSDQGTTFELHYANQSCMIEMPLHGDFNVYNALAAASVALSEGVTIEMIRDALKEMPSVPGRFEKIKEKAPFSVFVDFAHTPDGLKQCLTTARAFCRGRLIVVFGAGGDRDHSKRPIMGEVAARFSDLAIVTSDNPRSEEPDKIIDDILEGINGEVMKKFERVTERQKAIERAIEVAQFDDIILICGKGHEATQVIGDRILPFDDRVVAASCIREKIGKRIE